MPKRGTKHAKQPTKLLTMRLSFDDKARLKHMASESGLTVAGLVRAWIMLGWHEFEKRGRAHPYMEAKK